VDGPGYRRRREDGSEERRGEEEETIVRASPTTISIFRSYNLF
jgi:hypothetical protein